MLMYHAKMQNDINFIKNNATKQRYNTHFKVHDVVDIYLWPVRETKKAIINLFIYFYQKSKSSINEYINIRIIIN